MYSFNITILGEGHPLSPGWQGPGRYFNPPSPCGEGLPGGGLGTCIVVFQSTLPVWGGTSSIRNCRRTSAFQSTLPVWGGTISTGQLLLDTIISIHPPRVGRDHRPKALTTPTPKFQSTLPVWGGTRRPPDAAPPEHHFNPPSPCGEGQQKLTKILCKLLR